jgi:hypothetical protein
MDPHRSTPRIARLLAVLAIVAMPLAAHGGPSTDWQRQPRVLLAFAPTADDPRLAAQRAVFAALGDEAAERDLIFVAVAGTTVLPPSAGDADALRARHAVHAGAFRVLLVGKDGGVKLEAVEPVQGCALLALIDAMPMRRAQRRGAAAGPVDCPD